jgi:hypothetical protein
MPRGGENPLCSKVSNYGRWFLVSSVLKATEIEFLGIETKNLSESYIQPYKLRGFAGNHLKIYKRKQYGN